MAKAGKALKRVLEIYSITQNRLAVFMRVNRSSVFGWVNEVADPPSDTAVKIRKALQEIEISPSPYPRRRGEPDFSPFPTREGGWGVRSVCKVRGCDRADRIVN